MFVSPCSARRSVQAGIPDDEYPSYLLHTNQLVCCQARCLWFFRRRKKCSRPSQNRTSPGHRMAEHGADGPFVAKHKFVSYRKADAACTRATALMACAEQSRIVAPPPRKRAVGTSLWLARTLHCCAACCARGTAWTQPRKRIGRSSGSPTSAESPKHTLLGLSKKPSVFRRIAIC